MIRTRAIRFVGSSVVFTNNVQQQKEMIMVLTDSNNNPLPTTVQLNPLGDGITVYSVDDNAVALLCLWTLKPAGRIAQSFLGTLQGFTTSQRFVQSLSIGPAFSVTYIPPHTTLYTKNIHAVLTAVPVSGGAQRSIQISVQRPNTGEWS